ncbi:MAG: ABC transporter ATP-binding protein [Proteobacteria bacterium]|nr:ABC transporter ATP-binding protein [Pseudomonadota bacterium]
MTSNSGESVLKVEDLSVTFATESGAIRAVDHLSFEVKRGQTLGIVGESGCGKSVTCLAIMRLLPQPFGTISSGRILMKDMDIAALPKAKLPSIRGKKIAMIFQEPMTALNPVETVESQIKEVFQLHFPEMNAEAQNAEAIDLLKRVGINAPEQRLKSYPHQLSGGMRQRVMIAMALACKPDVLIADEPTTALDVTIQAQILELLRDLQVSSGMSIIFITHDLGVVAEMCDQVLVMYGGRPVEYGSVEDIFGSTSHPYTRGLLNSLPRLDALPKSVLKTIPGMVPPLNQMPQGCRFQTRCSHKTEICSSEGPKENAPTKIKSKTVQESQGHYSWCKRVDEWGNIK